MILRIFLSLRELEWLRGLITLRALFYGQGGKWLVRQLVLFVLIAAYSAVGLSVSSVLADSCKGCEKPTGIPDSFVSGSKPLILVTVPPQKYFVKRLAGEFVQVESVIPVSAGHGGYEPSVAQLKEMARAKGYLKVGHSGFGFEDEWLRRVQVFNPNLRVADSARFVADLSEDPHIWVSPRVVLKLLPVIVEMLELVLPERRETFAANLKAFEQDLYHLDTELQELFRGVKRREFVVFHPSWGYFARDYGLEQWAIEEEGKETDPARLARLITRAKEQGISTVFVQPQYSEAAAQVVADALSVQDAKGKLVSIDPFGENWLDDIRVAAAAIRVSLGH